MTEQELSPQLAAVLAAVRGHPGARGRDLSPRFGPGVYAVLKRLGEAGLVARDGQAYYAADGDAAGGGAAAAPAAGAALPADALAALLSLHLVDHMTYRDEHVDGNPWHVRLEGHMPRRLLDALTRYLAALARDAAGADVPGGAPGQAAG